MKFIGLSESEIAAAWVEYRKGAQARMEQFDARPRAKRKNAWGHDYWLWDKEEWPRRRKLRCQSIYLQVRRK
jgi:hypothetical protein